MAKIKLGERPKSFKHTVTFPMLDGSKGNIEVTYKYRTRTEYGTFLDDWRKRRKAMLEADQAQEQQARDAAAKAAAEAGQEPPAQEFSTGDAQRKISEASADFLLEIAEGWNGDDIPFERDGLEQLADDLPAAVAAMQDADWLAITEGRLGN